MSEAILKINDLKVNYGGIEAVKGISFDVPEGEIVTLIGANGAGKSSTLRAIAGLVKPRSGSIMFKGEELAQFIREIREKYNLTIFLIEHHMDLVMKISDYIYVIDFGSEIAQGVPKEIQSNQRVIDAYLGVVEDE